MWLILMIGLNLLAFASAVVFLFRVGSLRLAVVRAQAKVELGASKMAKIHADDAASLERTIKIIRGHVASIEEFRAGSIFSAKAIPADMLALLLGIAAGMEERAKLVRDCAEAAGAVSSKKLTEGK